MMLETALLLVSGLAAELPSRFAWPLPWLKAIARPAAYSQPDRAVDNWRFESALALDLSPMVALRLAAGGEPPSTPRCVKLNNYWCIKRGGWIGEIAADGEGHVAFATAEDGAAVAALLLRRYYVDYKRHSARAIVSRWAPARCALLPDPFRPAPLSASTVDLPAPRPASFHPDRKPASGKPIAPRAAASSPAAVAASESPRAEQSASGSSRMMPQRVVSMGLAPMGLENTLRAKWLAAHGRGGVAAPARPKATEEAEARVRRAKAGPVRAGVGAARRAPDLAPAPTIALGMGEPVRERPIEPQPASPAPPAAKPADAPRPIDTCVGERERLANYAARVIFGVVAGPDDDLVLFAADGAPTDNLAKVMANMAAVEIGPLRASSSLIAAGIAQMTRLHAKPNAPVAPLADNAPLPPPRP